MESIVPRLLHLGRRGFEDVVHEKQHVRADQTPWSAPLRFSDCGSLGKRAVTFIPPLGVTVPGGAITGAVTSGGCDHPKRTIPFGSWGFARVEFLAVS
ncbi:hypothetical protein M433DRAFT_528457 [Acidomyces richmondensis BFW]|nr:MAG: hypothetical protein FE78DRAFT_327296 [Acidomyces sp. 'richmondensis']KYG40809.1 hypothetical protein M433DRAFT_528457 [Acidomyces richmondensis BFW]